MNTELKRIETALNQLSRNDRSKPIPSRAVPIQRLASDPSVCSFTIHSSSSPAPFSSTSAQPLQHQLMQPSVAIAPSSPLLPLAPNPMTQKFQDALLSAPSQGASPGLVLGLLKEIESVVVKWQLELKQLQVQVQALYQEGPIIEGWLESQPSQGQAQSSAPGAIAPSVGTPPGHPLHPLSDASALGRSGAAGYYLHGRDADGRTWSRLCPPEQVPQISLAIARYQKLRQLLQRKQQLERSLGLLVQSLVSAHACVQHPSE